MSVQDVVELFNHPLGDGELRLALRTLDADSDWTGVPGEDDDAQLTFTLVHSPTGVRVNVAQERSLLGIWNSRI